MPEDTSVRHRSHKRGNRWTLWLAVCALTLPILAVGSAPSFSADSTLWGPALPNASAADDWGPVELGSRFSVVAPGSAVGVRFWRPADSSGPYSGTLWSSNGTKLASVNFSSLTASGWQSATFSSPVRLSVGASYVISYFAPKGRYVANDNAPVVTSATPALKVPSVNVGVYNYGGSSAFPTKTYQNSNYWVDVLFRPDSSPPPSTASSTPSASVETAPASTASSSPASSGGTVGAGAVGVPSGVSLRPSGSLVVTTPGTVIDGLDVSGSIYVAASNVTIQRTRVRSSSWAQIQVKLGTSGVVIRDVEIDGKGTSGASGSVGVAGPATVVRCDIHSLENGITPASGSVIRGNYIHDLAAPGDPHYDGIQMDGGLSDITIENNTVDMTGKWQTATVMIDNGFGRISNIRVAGNILKGAGYTVYADGSFRSDTLMGVVFDGNRFTQGAYGYALIRNAQVEWINNTTDSGQPLSRPS
ncbi:MAG: DUF4082 domain-containing protein [Actinobacteria bacterium]|nr:DUF4082 domain-containing protein [Actinomycetota bacterium]